MYILISRVKKYKLKMQFFTNYGYAINEYSQKESKPIDLALIEVENLSELDIQAMEDFWDDYKLSNMKLKWAKVLCTNNTSFTNS